VVRNQLLSEFYIFIERKITAEIGLNPRGTIKKKLTPDENQKLNFYTLILKNDGTYVISINGDEKTSGAIAKDFNFKSPLNV
jgi:hypothetical protein